MTTQKSMGIVLKINLFNKFQFCELLTTCYHTNACCATSIPQSEICTDLLCPRGKLSVCPGIFLRSQKIYGSLSIQ